MKKTVIRRIIAACIFTATGTAYGQNTFPATGNVGIGTSSPSFNLDVPGLAAFSGSGANLDPKRTNNFVPLQNSGKLLIGWNRIAGNGETDLIANMGPGNVGGFSFYDYSNTGVWTSLMRILANGNVGIGTTTPGVPLDVHGLSNFSEQLYSHKGYRLASSNTDVTNGGPWYGMGVIDSASFGKQIVQTAGYFGVYLKTMACQMLLTQGGNVGIGLTSNISEKLTVAGNVKAQGVIITTSGWPDYVFKKDYKLPSLSALSEQINTEGHLPDLPSAEDVAANGQNLGEINKKLLQKVEELTLYIIQQDKQNSETRETVKKQQSEIEELNRKVETLLSNSEKNNNKSL